MSTTNIQPHHTSTNADVPSAPPEPHRQAGIALRASEGEGDLTYLLLGCLRLDERNVRKDMPSVEELEALADLIEAQGLLQNLTVVQYAAPRRGKGKQKGRTYTHGVIAGGRRLRALLRLVERKVLTLDEEVLCRVVPESRALAISAAENSHKPMSVADTVLAFADMVRAGAGVEELARSFSLAPKTVERRLKLAGVAPSLFEKFRAGEIMLDQLQALALAPDHATQEAVWAALPAYSRSARAVRGMITGAGVSEALVAFVGLDAYTAAGGAVLHDLFAEDNDETDHIQDPGLITRLATEKLEQVADALRGEGVAWVETFLAYGYNERQQFSQPPTDMREPSNDEAAELKSIAEAIEPLQTEIDALYDGDEPEDEQAAAAQHERLSNLEASVEELEQREREINESRQFVSEAILPLVGAVAYINDQGKLKVERHLMHRKEAESVNRANAKAATASRIAENGGTPPPDLVGVGLSERLCRQLTSHRTRALQAMLISHQREALASLVHPLLMTTVRASIYRSQSVVKVRGESCNSQLATWAPDLAESPAEQVVSAEVAACNDLMPEDDDALLPWLLAQPLDTLLRLLTLCSALSLNAIGQSLQPAAEPIEQAVGLAMKDWWKPTGPSYLSHVSKALIGAAVADAGFADEVPKLDKLKKAEAVEKAEQLLAGSGWVPGILR